MVEEVGAEDATDDPVESAVLEDVPHRHGVRGESMDEERLQLSLDVVQHDQGKGDPLALGHGLRCVGIDVGTGEYEEDAEEDGAKVFDHVDVSPTDLGS